MRKFFSIIIIIFIITIGVYGNYFPFLRSKVFIQLLRDLPNLPSFGEFKERVDEVFSIPSPVGDEEIVKQLSSVLSGIIRSTSDPKIAFLAAEYLNSLSRRVIEERKAVGFGQTLYIASVGNLVAFSKTKNGNYLQKAEEYLAMGREFSPTRPQYLYGLFDLYRIKNETGKAIEVAEQILNYWPQDRKIRELIAELIDKNVSQNKSGG